MIDQALLGEVQYALLEPVIDGGQSWLSEVWSRDEVLGNYNAAVWTVLRDTRAIVTFATITQPAASAGTVALPLDWMTTVSLAYRDGGTLLRTPLPPTDRFEADLGSPTWEDTPAPPIAYNEQEGDTLQMTLVPANATDGTVELLYVARPVASTGAGAVIPLPEELCTMVKYRTIGFLLQTVGRLIDPDRSAYCTQRYDLEREVTRILLSGWA
jgi:hypothetical protein